MHIQYIVYMYSKNGQNNNLVSGLLEGAGGSYGE